MVYSGIGGQAVMEGVMMKSPDTIALSVRTPGGSIVTETKPAPPSGGQARSLPFIRGVLAFADSFLVGMPALMRSAELSGEEEEEEALSEKEIHGVFALSLVLAIGLFMGVPFLVSRLLAKVVASAALLAFLEGLFRLGLFIGYIVLISRMEEIRRVFMYHGAEHKCINCIEHGLPLTVENVRNSSRQHKRCGTSFLVFVLLISVFLFMFIRFDSPLLQLAARLLLLPVIAGISYECIRFAGRSESKVIAALSVPGMLVQNLTTREPADDMIEVGIASVEASFDWRSFLRDNRERFGEEQAAAIDAFLKEEEDRLAPARRDLYLELETALKNAGVPDADVDARRILESAAGLSATALAADPQVRVSKEEAAACRALAEERKTRRPLQYLLGEQEFMGLPFAVSEGVLIPRQDTEHLVQEALSHVPDGAQVLDLCTGTGCVLLSVLKLWRDAHPDGSIAGTGADLSDEALSLAQKNAEALGVECAFKKSDLYEAVGGPFDVITANPPYIPSADIETLMPEVRDFEPRLALDGGADGLDLLRRIISEAPKHLNGGGWLLCEIGHDQGAAASALFEQAGFEDVSVKKDYGGCDRVVSGRMPLPAADGL